MVDILDPFGDCPSKSFSERKPLSKKQKDEIDARVEREYQEYLASHPSRNNTYYHSRNRNKSTQEHSPWLYFALGALLAMAFCSDSEGAIEQSYKPQQTYTIEHILK